MSSSSLPFRGRSLGTSRGRLFGSLCGLVFLVNMARVVFAPLLSEFIAEFGITESTAGLVVTLAWVGSALPRIPTGWLLTRVPRHHVVLGTGAVLTVAAAFTASASSVPTLAVGALLMGLASGAYFVAANPLVSELFPERVGRAMGVHGAANQVAAVLAAPVVTLAVLYDWRLAFVGIGVAAALVTLLIFRTARRTDLPEAGREDRDLLAGARSEWRVILLGVVILGTAGFVWQGVFNFYELFMRQRGLAPTAAKNTLTLIFAAGVPAFLLSGRLADRLPQVPYLLSILAAFVANLLLLTAVDGLLALLAVTVSLGYVVHSLFPAMDTYLLDTLPDETRGSAYAVYSGSMMLVQALGASVVGALASSGFAYATVFRGLALALGVVVLGLVVGWATDRLPT